MTQRHGASLILWRRCGAGEMPAEVSSCQLEASKYRLAAWPERGSIPELASTLERALQGPELTQEQASTQAQVLPEP